MALPNFFILGASRSGTTSLYHYLKQHPDVFMCPKKEPNFYLLEGVADNLRGKGTSGWLKTCATTRADELTRFRCELWFATGKSAYRPMPTEAVKGYVSPGRDNLST
jgi:hypothetical protein